MLRAARLCARRRACNALFTPTRTHASRTLLRPVSSSSSSSPASRYPFPTAPQPTPYEIFHLPPGSTQEEIKARYYELVRVHHPDAPGAPPQAQARFLAIKAAYDVLRGLRPGVAGDVPGESAAARAKRDLDAAIWRAKQARRADTFTSGGDDRWQDRLLITLVVVAVVGFVVQSTMVRQRAMAENIEYAKMRRADRAVRHKEDVDEDRPA